MTIIWEFGSDNIPGADQVKSFCQGHSSDCQAEPELTNFVAQSSSH